MDYVYFVCNPLFHLIFKYINFVLLLLLKKSKMRICVYLTVYARDFVNLPKIYCILTLQILTWNENVRVLNNKVDFNYLELISRFEMFTWIIIFRDSERSCDNLSLLSRRSYFLNKKNFLIHWLPVFNTFFLITFSKITLYLRTH